LLKIEVFASGKAKLKSALSPSKEGAHRMSRQEVLNSYAQSLDRLLRLKSYPIAIKMLASEREIPAEAKWPVKDYGYRMLTCQAFSESRRAGATIVQMKKEIWCTEAAVGYGFIEPVDYFMEGNTRYPEGIISTLEGSKYWAREFPRLDYKKYAALVSAPLNKATFEPDVVMIYGNSLQIAQLIFARTWIDGYEIRCRMSAQGACVHAVVPVLQTGECQVAFPCLGDRRRAGAQDDEVIFSAPVQKLGALIDGLNAMEEKGLGLPVAPRMEKQGLMLKSYMEMAKLTGMID
jgi:uncharacterized protein (DUF169 family)